MKQASFNMKVKINVKLGWRPQVPDIRDKKYTFVPKITPESLPSKVDLRGTCPPVYDQGELGSCTANAIAGAYEFEMMKQNLRAIIQPSRLMIYFNERAMEGTTDQDAGAEIRDGIKSVASQGVCSETEWPYEIDRFTVKPTEECYADALKNLLENYLPVNQTLLDLKSSLAEGFPIVFGISVYDSLMSDEVAQTGVVPMPNPETDTLEGGHAIMGVGYDDTKQVFIIRNSWGVAWGDKGYFYLPYDYVTSADLASDFWSIRLVEAN
jgi:C1A family cysteine protease